MNDRRYDVIKAMIKEGRINTLADIFLYIPKTVVATDLGLNVSRFGKSVEEVESLRVRDIYELANLCHLSALEMFELIDKQRKLNEKSKEK